MKKCIFYLWLSCFSPLLSLAQLKTDKVDILWGQELKDSKKATLSDIVGYDNTGIYAIKTQRKGLYGARSSARLEHYDNAMNQSRSVELALPERDLEFILQLDNQLYLFTSFRNQRLRRNLLFVQGINKNSLLPEGKPLKIAEIDYSGENKRNAGSFDFEKSIDGSKVLIYYQLPHNKRESEQFGFHVFDSKLKLLWEKEITLPYQEELFDIEDYEVDNLGNVHVLGLAYKEKRKEKRKGEPNYQYQILSYFEQGNELKEYAIDIPGKFLTDMQITINDDRDIICGGFYSNEGTFSIKGSYFLKVNGANKAITATAFKEFGIDFITQNMRRREENKAKRKAEKGKNVELYEYDLDEIILKENGGAVLIGEQYFVEKVITSFTDAAGNRNTTTTYEYHYNDIIVINMSAEGNIEWVKKIPKRQHTANDQGFYSSYALSVVKDKLYFVFNDHPKNLYYTGSGKLFNFNKGPESLVVLATLDSQGKLTREGLFFAKQADILTRPLVCEQVSENEMVLFGQRKKTHRFAKLTFK